MRTSFVRWGATALVAILLGSTAAAQAAPEAEPQTRLTGVVNVNTATAEQLELLPSIGPARARAIISYRKEHGGFKRVDDLENVSGIGGVALERIRPHCVTQGATTAKLE